MVTAQTATNQIFALQESWTKELPKPRYGITNAVFPYEESQSYDYRKTVNGVVLCLIIEIKRNVLKNTNYWGVVEGKPSFIVKDIRQNQVIETVSKTCLTRFLKKISDQEDLVYKVGDLLYWHDRYLLPFSKVYLTKLLFISDIDKDMNPTWCIASDMGDNGWDGRYYVPEEQLFENYDPSDFVYEPLALEMLQSLTSDAEIDSKGNGILILPPLQRQKAFLALSRELWGKFKFMCREDDRYLGTPTEETLDCFADHLKCWFENP